jgi:hypothetical protein
MKALVGEHAAGPLSLPGFVTSGSPPDTLRITARTGKLPLISPNACQGSIQIWFRSEDRTWR